MQGARDNASQIAKSKWSLSGTAGTTLQTVDTDNPLFGGAAKLCSLVGVGTVTVGSSGGGGGGGAAAAAVATATILLSSRGDGWVINLRLVS